VANDLSKRVQQTLERQRGVVFAQPALVGRAMYTGRDIIANNSRFAPGYQDERGYVPVEWWIMSMTAAANDIPKPGEGVTRLILDDGDHVPLTEAAAAAGDVLFGEYLARWPLTKVLDIGGEPVVPDFGPFSRRGSADQGGTGAEPEVPPIPFHVHSGEVVAGRIRPPGKLEAYFFLPVDVPPYHRDLGRVVSRLGLKPGTTREDVLAALREFGTSDAMYALGVAYEVRPYEGWTILPGTLHAPGPWPTFEIQLPQDDFNFAAWQLGVRVSGAQRESLRQQMMLRGLRDEEDFLQQAVDWETSTDPRFKERFHRKAQLLESGPWGRRLRIFFDRFYGEGIEIEPRQRYVRTADPRPWAGIVWSGEGRLNGFRIGVRGTDAMTEFLVTPGHEAAFENDSEVTLRVYTVFPLAE